MPCSTCDAVKNALRLNRDNGPYSTGPGFYGIPAVASSNSGGGAPAFPDITGQQNGAGAPMPKGNYGIQSNDPSGVSYEGPFGQQYGADISSGFVSPPKPGYRSLNYTEVYHDAYNADANIPNPPFQPKGFRPLQASDGSYYGPDSDITTNSGGQRPIPWPPGSSFSRQEGFLNKLKRDAQGVIDTITGAGGTGGGGTNSGSQSGNSNLGAISPSGSGLTIGGDTGGLLNDDPNGGGSAGGQISGAGSGGAYYYGINQAPTGDIWPDNSANPRPFGNRPFQYGGGTDYVGADTKADATGLFNAFGQVYGDPLRGGQQPRPFQRNLNFDTGSGLQGAAIGGLVALIFIAPFVYTELGRSTAKKAGEHVYRESRKRIAHRVYK